MNKLALARFIVEHPYHYMCQYFQNLINCSINDTDMTKYDIIHELIRIAKQYHTFPKEELEPLDILLTNLTGHG